MLSKSSRMFSTFAAKKVGFVGLGNMGLSMSAQIANAGHHVKGFDLNEQAMEAATKNGVTPASSLKDVSQGVDYIVTSLPRGKDVDTVLQMKDGVFESADKGTIILDTSTISPVDSKKFHELAKQKDLKFMDTPVTGGTVGALNGQLVFFIGAPNKEDYESAKLICEAMGTKFFHCGDIGTGEMVKMCNNLMIGIQMFAASEGMALGVNLGIDPKILANILQVSTGGANLWVLNGNHPTPGVMPNSPSSRNYEGGFQVGLIKKDIKLGLDLAELAKTQLLLAEMSTEMYQDIEDQGHGLKDFGYAYQYVMKNGKLN